MIQYTNEIFFGKGSSTLPRATTRTIENDGGRQDKVAAATSSTSLYDNVGTSVVTGSVSQSSGQGKYLYFKLCKVAAVSSHYITAIKCYYDSNQVTITSISSDIIIQKIN